MTLDAVIFDFDGVILDSAGIKTRAFAELFADRPDHVDSIVALHLAQEGISRHEKFRQIHRDILREPLPEARHKQLAERFEQLVRDAVVATPFIAGAESALANLQGVVPLFVASGTPDDELKWIITQRGLNHLFVETLGSPPGKAALLADILARHGLTPARVLMVGDARTDYDAAISNGMPFIGITPPEKIGIFPAGITTLPNLVGLDRHMRIVFGLPNEAGSPGETEVM